MHGNTKLKHFDNAISYSTNTCSIFTYKTAKNKQFLSADRQSPVHKCSIYVFHGRIQTQNLIMLHDALPCNSHPRLHNHARLRQRHSVAFDAHSVVDVLE